MSLPNRRWLWALPIAQMAAIFWASSVSDLPALPGGVSDKVAHFAAYAVLAALADFAAAGGRWAQVNRQSAWRAFLIAAAYGAFDEGHQAFTPRRVASAADWVADALGAITAIALVQLVAMAVGRRAARRGV